LFGREDYVVVLTVHRLERGPVSSRVGVFPEVVNVTDRGRVTRDWMETDV